MVPAVVCIMSLEVVLTLRVQVPKKKVLGILVIIILVQVLGKYMIVGHLDP